VDKPKSLPVGLTKQWQRMAKQQIYLMPDKSIQDLSPAIAVHFVNREILMNFMQSGTPAALVYWIAVAYVFGKGGLCCLYNFSGWMIKRFEKDEPTYWGRAGFAISSIFLVGWLNMPYLWIALKALGAAGFLYVCGVGLRCIYLDLRVWMIRRREASAK
jgi:hypothetical protein